MYFKTNLPPQIVAHRPVQRFVRTGVRVRGPRRQPAHGSGATGGARVAVPPGTLRGGQDQTHTHLQSGPEVWEHCQHSHCLWCLMYTALTGWLRICFSHHRGRSPEWYNKAFGHLCVNEVQMIRSSFHLMDQMGTEAKIWSPRIRLCLGSWALSRVTQVEKQTHRGHFLSTILDWSSLF